MASIKDVAKIAGVSITTVSRALNGYSDINEDTRKRILEIANKLGYRPNAAARSLVKKESRLFGYIVSGLEKGAKHTMVQECLCGMYEYTNAIDYEILMFAVDSKKQHTKSYLQFAMEHSLAGIIVQGIRTDDAYYKELLDSKIPCVLIDLDAENTRVGSISSDNFEAAREAVGYLIETGHEHIAFINGKDAAVVSRMRYQGYIYAMQERGLTIPSDYILKGNFSEEEAYDVTIKLLTHNPKVTAIFCASDLMAIGAMKAVQNLGKEIPKDISVIGFDDILISSYVSPTLSTVHQNFYEMGFEAAKMLYNITQNQDVPHTKKIPYELIIRQSSK